MKASQGEPLCVVVLLMVAMVAAQAASQSHTNHGDTSQDHTNHDLPNHDPAQPHAASDTDLTQLVSMIRGKAKILENSSGMRLGFESFTTAYKIAPKRVSYSDFVTVRLLYEATRDAGFWNMHWTITDQPPVSDKIWHQWRSLGKPSLLRPTASAECDELSALYSFLVRRAGVKGVGLFWPTYNHTVAVWELHPAGGPVVRVVVPTSQIFLGMNDSFGTRKFNPWHQKTIYEYVRRDVADSFVVPKPLFDLFLLQVDKYAGATDSTLQQLRYLREGVFLKYWTAENAARDAFSRQKDLHAGPPEDVAAFQNFARDMRSEPVHDH
jgi:hypothetical protein